jgi:hypothetical protein
MPVDRTLAHRGWRALVWAAYAWAVGNCAYVYLAIGGTRTYRVEASALIFLGILVPAFVLSPPAASRRSWPRGHTFFLLTLATALWLLALAPEIGLPFLGDDYVFVDRYRTAADAFNSPISSGLSSRRPSG